MRFKIGKSIRNLEPTQEEIETGRERRNAKKEEVAQSSNTSSDKRILTYLIESRKAAEDGQSDNTSSSERSPKCRWDPTPQNIWISNSLPGTSQLKFKLELNRCGMDPEIVLKKSKLHYTGTESMLNEFWLQPETVLIESKVDYSGTESTSIA